MTTVNPVQTSTYVLTTANNPITFGAATDIDVSAGVAVAGSPSTYWNITNYGTLSGAGGGVLLASEGTVTNAGSIGGGVTLGPVGTIVNKSGGLITGGIELDDGGTVTNEAGGVITNSPTDSVGISSSGVDSKAFTTVINAGTITATNSSAYGGWGIALSSAGAVTNQSGGTIKGNVTGVGLNIGGNVTNGGAISGLTYAGVDLGGGGMVTNTGSIAGARLGVNLRAGGTVTNETQGTISGGSDGVYVKGGAGTVMNAGSIISSNEGVELADGGTVNNQPGGTITGAGGSVYIKGGTGIVTNAGSLIGGVWLQTYGTVTNGTSGTINGNNPGGGYGVGLHAGGSLTNASKITGLDVGVDLDNGGTVSNNNGGKISGEYFGVLMGLVGREGGGGNVTNNAGGTIDGDFGVYSEGGAATVTNAGSIIGTTAITLTKNNVTFALGDGVSLHTGGTVTNQAGGSITGVRDGVYITGGAGAVTNAGTISGTSASVEFAGSGTNTLTLQTGSVLNGDIIGSTAQSASNALVLQGTGTANNIFENFNTLDVESGAAWKLGGSSTISETTVAGTLTVTGALISAITITGSGILVFTGASDDEVAFQAGSGGTLKLDHSLKAAFTGDISGLTQNDTIDLADLSFVKGHMAATFNGSTTGGVLTISNGKETVQLELTGNYLNSSWSLSNDHSHGTFVTDHPTSATGIIGIVQEVDHLGGSFG